MKAARRLISGEGEFENEWKRLFGKSNGRSVRLGSRPTALGIADENALLCVETFPNFVGLLILKSGLDDVVVHLFPLTLCS